MVTEVKERLATLEAVITQLVEQGKIIVLRMDKLLDNDSVKLQRIAKLETRQSMLSKILGGTAGTLGAGIVAALIALLV